MKFIFSDEINEFLKIITENARNNNIRVFFVGGMVRDNLLSKPVVDIDLIVQGNAIDFAYGLPSSIKIKSVHKDFGTVKVLYNDLEFDIASTRVEKYPDAGCLPLVYKIGVSVFDDVKRRDFSINSLYVELKLINNEINYELIDLVSGVSDIQNKVLRVLHNKSYIDDPSRILRGLSFKYRFGFDFSTLDKKLITEYLKNPSYSSLSFDRLYSVLGIILNQDLGYDIFCEFVKMKYYRILKDKKLDIDIQRLKKIKELFELSNSEFSTLCVDIIKNQDITLITFKNKLEIYNIFSKLNIVNLAYYYYKTSDNNVLIYLKIKHIKIKTKGEDLINLNYPKGKLFSDILNSLLLEKLNNPSKFENKNDEIKWVLSNYPLK